MKFTHGLPSRQQKSARIWRGDLICQHEAFRFGKYSQLSLVFLLTSYFPAKRFQNKRQSSRSRTNAAANPPMMHHPYMSGSSSSAGLSHLPIPGQGHSGAEMSVSPSAHGGSYTVQPSGSGSHRSYRAQSPPNPPPLESLRRARSPEGSSRLRAPAGRP